MLETGNGLQAAHANGKEGNMNLDESITEFSMWAIAASPLVVTTPIFNCSDFQERKDAMLKTTLQRLFWTPKAPPVSVVRQWIRTRR